MTSTYSFASPTVPRLVQARAIHSVPYAPASIDSHDQHTPIQTITRRIAVPRTMAELSPTTSTPSIYSRAAHASPRRRRPSPPYRPQQLRIAESEASDDEGDSDDHKRLSMVSGPRLTKYGEDLPWENEEWSRDSVVSDTGLGIGGLSRQATRMVKSAARGASRSRNVSPSSSVADSTKRGFAQILGVGKHNLMPSASGTSLASTQTGSTASMSSERLVPVTPKLKAAFGAPRSPTSNMIMGGNLYDDEDETPHAVTRREAWLDPSAMLLHAKVQGQAMMGDRPLLSSGSPGFGLISLEVAQEREKVRNMARGAGAKGPKIPAPIPVPQPRSPLISHPEPITYPTSMISDPPPRRSSGTPDHSAPPPPPPDPISPPIANRLKGKKSGLMKYFNKTVHAATPGQSRALRTAPFDARPEIERGDSMDDARSTYSGQSKMIWDPETHLDVNPIGAKLQLELRPISITFTNGLPSDYLSGSGSPPSNSSVATNATTSDTTTPQLQSSVTGESDIVSAMKEQIGNARKAWRVQLCELEAQIRELRDELEDARSGGVKVGGHGCEACGCECGGAGAGVRRKSEAEGAKGVMDRGRAKTAGARGVFGSGSLYEWE